MLVASAVTLILVGRSGGPPAAAEGVLRSVARAAFVPVESAGDAAFRPLEGLAGGFGRRADLVEARSALARERERAQSEAARADALAAEARRLAALLGLEGPAAADGVAARVVSTGEGHRAAPLVLDRGSRDGIRTGMPVVAAGGLVGRVLEVGPGHSTVLPVTDGGSAVGVRSVPAERPSDGGPTSGAEPLAAIDRPGAGNGAAGVVQGLGGARLRLELLDPSAPLRAGDLVVTSGLRHSRFPAGLPVGRVAGERGRFFVRPFAPPDRLEVVKVLRWEPPA
ncbi:MAG: rod shape-determining protein MreC [Actinomycetota bacterium]